MTKFQTELPENYVELKKKANYTSSWRDRLDAVKELSNYKDDKVIDLLNNRLENDTVQAVREAAHKALVGFGQNAAKPQPHKYDLIKGTDKILIRILKSLPKDSTVADFADKLKRTRLDVYDAYEGSKGNEFMAWLEEKMAKLRK
ncbi:HEAT repeat domain-containing protein [Solibacillus sp. FSL H8-0538]|uniref:HEAT repeat domain-containing protein n=1 Tax=Solibacillus sp. FSL H8-0538 TaxID=2921400 RepID=UPI0030F7887E